MFFGRLRQVKIMFSSLPRALLFYARGPFCIKIVLFLIKYETFRRIS